MYHSMNHYHYFVYYSLTVILTHYHDKAFFILFILQLFTMQGCRVFLHLEVYKCLSGKWALPNMFMTNLSMMLLVKL